MTMLNGTVNEETTRRSATKLLAYLRSIGVHLQMEGETLRLNAPKGALTPELQAELKMNKAELLDLVRTARTTEHDLSTAAIKRVERREHMPLSLAQQRLWFLSQMEPESPAYNVIALLRMKGQLDADALERSFQRIIRRHEVLRSCFVQIDALPFTKIVDGSTWTIARPAWKVLPSETLEAAVTRFVVQTAHQPFDLRNGPLLRTWLLPVNSQDLILVVCVHHIVSDGWSMGVICQELADNYRRILAKDDFVTPELTIQYCDYAAWQRKWLDGGVLEKQLAYWRRALAGAPSLSIFPPDHPRPLIGSERSKRRKVIIGSSLHDRLQAFSRSHDVTLFMTMVSAFMLLLSRFSGLKDVVIGSPSANRTRAELGELVGFFVNNLVLRAQVQDGMSFFELLTHVRETTFNAYENQDVPFDALVREVQADRSGDYAPVFQTMFILQNFPLEELDLAGVTVSPLEIEDSIARYDLTVEIYPHRGELNVFFDYRTDLYDDESIATLQTSFLHVLDAVISHPEKTVETVSLLPDNELRTAAMVGNPPMATLPDRSLLLDKFAEAVNLYPCKIAVKDDQQALSYKDLDEASSQLAMHLWRAGVKQGSLVPVCLGRTSELVVALLAIMKTGAAYVPLDPIYPRHRIAGILDDVNPQVLVTNASCISLLLGFESRCIIVDDQNCRSMHTVGTSARLSRDVSPSSTDLAYVIFTSGSTGKPKGVEISHGALANFLDSMRKEPGFSPEDKILAVTTMSFDIAGLELFLPLYVGGQCVVAGNPSDLDRLLNDLERSRPTVMQATPALWQLLVSADWAGSTELTALCGGEALSTTLAEKLLPKVKCLWNMYGPTETTIWSSVYKVRSCEGASIPIGPPIQNTAFFVFDSLRQPVPSGVAGELYIGGDGLAQGYLQRPELTEERFILMSSGERLYRTGDLVRRRRDGSLEFLGRADFQVKLRGFRIELGEIEHLLRQQPEVSECVVVLREHHGEKELVAYLVAHSGAHLSYMTLRNRLRERLPEYMVPAHGVVLAAFPRLPNGKLDRTQLPPVNDELEATMPPVSCLTPTEASLASILAELLQVENIAPHQRFFDLGAHSLLLVKVHDRIRKELDPDLRLVSLFQFSSVASLAAHIDGKRRGDAEEMHVVQR